MKTRKKSYFGLGLGKLLVILLVVLGTTYFIWQFMFVINSKNSKAAETNSCGGLAPGQSRCRTTETYDQLKANGVCQTKLCLNGKECKQIGDHANCVKVVEDSCTPKGNFCTGDPNSCLYGTTDDSCPPDTENNNRPRYCCSKKPTSTPKPNPTTKPNPTSRPKPTVGQCGGTCVSSGAFCTGNDGRVVLGSCAGSKVCCEFD